MKGSATPPRRRSLFVRGYDRAPLEGRLIAKPSTSRKKTAFYVGLLLFVFASFGLLFRAGYSSAQPSPTSEFNEATVTKQGNPPGLRSSAQTEYIDDQGKSIKRLNIAIAVTVTRDGPYLDGAAVLQHSIRMTQSRHNLEMVAIVHAGVQSTRPALRALGFKILEFPPPIESKEIKGKHLRETIDKSGCCGALELLKICAWRLEEYDWVVSMDMDAIWLQSLDHIFEKDIPKGGFYFTYDFAMDNPGSKAPPVQGGFIVVRPSQLVYDRLIDIVREGDFRPNTGWAGSNIGWCWGGQTVQGLLAYFATLIEPALAFPLDPCVYNSMATTKICRRVEYDAVKSIHYTVCQKPWECHQGDNEICAKFLHAWWMVRNDLEKSQGLSPVGRCCGIRNSGYCPQRSYHKIDIDNMKQLPMSNPDSRFVSVGPIVNVPADLPSRQGKDD